MQYDARPVQLLAKGLENYRQKKGLSHSGMQREFPFGSTSKVRRVLVGEGSIPFGWVKPVADALAVKIGISREEMIACLFCDRLPCDSRFTDLVLANVVRWGRTANKGLATTLTTSMAGASTVIWRDSFLPVWLAPDPCMLYFARCSQGLALNFRQLRAKLALARPARQLLLGMPAPARTIIVPVLQSELETMLGEKPPFDHFPSARTFELIEDVARNAVPLHGVRPGVAEDSGPPFPSVLREYLRRSPAIIAVDNRMVIREAEGAWLVYDRRAGDETARYIDAQVATLCELRRHVRHGLTVFAICEMLERILSKLRSAGRAI
jgi:hypothetical protein